jgi:hypothetical protein
MGTGTGDVATDSLSSDLVYSNLLELELFARAGCHRKAHTSLHNM